MPHARRYRHILYFMLADVIFDVYFSPRNGRIMARGRMWACFSEAAQGSFDGLITPSEFL